jgi:ribose transport system substrate-binding protein
MLIHRLPGLALAAGALAAAVGPGGKVVIQEGNPEADNAKERKLGLKGERVTGWVKTPVKLITAKDLG